MLNQSKRNPILIAIFLFSLAISLIYSFYFKINPAVDAAAYDKTAWNLVLGNGYKENTELSYEKDIAILRVGPGYQFFLAGVYYIFGRNYEIVWVINAILHALTALLVYFLSREVFGPNWNEFLGVTSAIFIGFSPDLITMSGMLMTETLAVFLITVFLFLFFKYLNSVNRSVYLVVLSAAFFGFAVLTRTTAILMIIPTLYYFFVERKFKRAALFLIIIAILLSPWTIRNYRVYGAFIPTTNVFGYDFLVGNHPGATGELEAYEPAENYIYGYGSVKGSRLALKDALAFIKTKPLEFIKITFNRVSIYFSFVRPTGFWFHLKGAARAVTLVLSAIYSVLIFGFGFLGVYKSGKNPVLTNNTKYIFWLLVMMPLSVIFIFVETRYRFLVYPFFAVFAGLGLSDLFTPKRQNFKAVIAIFGILLLNSAIDCVQNLDRIIERLSEFL